MILEIKQCPLKLSCTNSPTQFTVDGHHMDPMEVVPGHAQVVQKLKLELAQIQHHNMAVILAQEILARLLPVIHTTVLVSTFVQCKYFVV